MYVMHEDRPLGIPSESYYEICRQGYEDFGFTEERLKPVNTPITSKPENIRMDEKKGRARQPSMPSLVRLEMRNEISITSRTLRRQLPEWVVAMS